MSFIDREGAFRMGPEFAFTGVYKSEAQVPPDYCAVGVIQGRGVALPERNLRAAMRIDPGDGRLLQVFELANPRPGSKRSFLNMTAFQVKAALAVIDAKAPYDRIVSEKPDLGF